MRAITLALLSLPLASQTFDATYFATTGPKIIMETAADKARTLNSLDSRLQAEYGRAYLAAGLRKKAEESFLAATTLDPKDSETCQLVARAWFQNGFKTEGYAALEPLRKPRMKYVSGYALAAVDLLKYGTPAEAEVFMEAGAATDKRSWRDFFAFGHACAEAGHADLAAKWFCRDVSDNDALDDLLKEAVSFLAAGHAKEADALMAALDPAKRHNREAMEAFGDACLASGQVDLGRKWFKAAKVEVDGDPVRVGIIALEAEDLKKAQDSFVQAQGESGGDEAAVRRIAQAWWKHGFKAESMAALKAFTSGKSEDADGYLSVAEDLVATGRPVTADALMETMWSRNPKEWEKLLQFGTACITSGEAALAWKWMRKASQKREAKEHLTKGAIDLLDTGHKAEAQEFMALAYEIDPGDWEDCVEFARAAVRHEDLALAATYMARAVERNAGSYRMWNEIALAYADKGAGIRNHFWLAPMPGVLRMVLPPWISR